MCVSRDAARGAPSWLAWDSVAHTFCFMSDGTLAPAARVARCWGCNVWGWARGRAAAALFWTSGARGAAAPLEEVMAHLRPWSSRCERVKAASLRRSLMSLVAAARRRPALVRASRPPPPLQGARRRRCTAPAPRVLLFGPRRCIAAPPTSPSTVTIIVRGNSPEPEQSGGSGRVTGNPAT